MKGYELIVETLEKYGVNTYFYCETMFQNVVRELKKKGIKTVLAHTENAIGYMADGYARATGKPGICAVQSIGAANLAAGLYDACLANTPVVAITGKKQDNLQYTAAYQEAEHRLLFEGITKFNAELNDVRHFPYLFRRLFKDAVTGRPGPVHLDVPNNCGIPTEFAEFADNELYIQMDYNKYPPARPALTDNEKLAEAADAIAKAKKPLLIVGRGAVISGAGKELYELAKKADIPIVTTPDGKTIINEDDPLWAGIIGTYGMVCANNIAMTTDLAVIVGSQVSDQTTTGWTMPPRATKVIQIDIDPREPGMKYPDAIGLVGDAKIVLNQLGYVVKDIKRPEWRKEVSAEVNKTLSEYKELQSQAGKIISPERLCAEITRALPDNAILFSDTGNSAIWSGIMVRMKETQSYYRAAGTLGWGFPASLGGKCGVPDRPVYCICGDGAIYFHMSEMETAVRNNINTVTIINNNGGYVQTREMLDIVYENESEEEKQRTYKFSDTTNFSKVAEAMGCWARRVTEADEIYPALKEAEASGRPAVVEVLTSESYPPNPRSNGPRPLYGFTRFKAPAK